MTFADRAHLMRVLSGMGDAPLMERLDEMETLAVLLSFAAAMADLAEARDVTAADLMRALHAKR